MVSRARRRRRIAIDRKDVVRLLPLAIVAVFALWLTVAVSGANIIRANRPDLALNLMPFDARAQARAAERALQDIPARGSTRDAERQGREAERLAREALSRDATVVSAWRTLGFGAAIRRDEDARRFFQIAERVSRRDSPTQIWLIEDSVGRDDIRSALRHYDTALRTSRSTHDLLLPILVRAVSDDAIVGPLANMLSAAPAWRRWFFVKMTEQAPPGDKTVALLAMLRRSAPLPEQDLVANLTEQYAVNGQYSAAMRIYQLLRPRGDGALLLRNGDFERDNPVPPLDWRLEHRPDLGSDQRAADGEGRGQSLQVYAASGVGGVAASQMMMLAPGTYSLSWSAGASDGARPADLRWQVVCANEQTIRLVEAPALTPAGRVPASSRQFRVPANCPAQLLLLTVRADYEPESVGGWVDGVRIQSAGRAAP